MSTSKVLKVGLFLITAVCSNFLAETFAQTDLQPPVDAINERAMEFVEPMEIIVPTSVFEPKWVWSSATTENQSVVLIQQFNLARIPQFARLDITVDNEYTIEINNKVVPNPKNAKDWKTIDSIDVKDWLIVGDNLLQINATNQDGPAGAIALIQMRTNGVLAEVGTGQQSQILTGNLLTPATVVGDAFGAPWNLPQPASESAKSVQARRETKRLIEEIESSDAEISARAMVLLAHLSVEQANTSFDDPIFNLTATKPLVSILQKAKEKIRDELHIAQDPLNQTPKVKLSGSLSAAKYLISEGKADAVQEFFAAEFSQPRSNVESFQIAVISTVGGWIASDDTAIQEARTKVKTQTDQVDSKAAELKVKRAEIESSKLRSNEIRASLSKLESRRTAIKNERLAIKDEITLLQEVKPKTDAIATRISDLELRDALLGSEDAFLEKVTKPSLEKENAEEGARINAAMAAAIVLDEQLKKLKKQLSDLETALNKLVTESIELLNSVEKFLVNNRSHLASGFVRALNAETLDAIRTSRLTFLEIDAFNVAIEGFEKPSGTAETISAFGARTSASDLPGVSDRSIGDRPGVSATAPFDPTATGTTRVFLPASDYQGERELRGAKNNPDSTVEKAPGAKGAVFIRSK